MATHLILKKLFKTGIISEHAPQADPALRTREQELHEEILKVFGQAVAIRHVDAGSCNGCELDIHDLNDVFWAYLTRGRADSRAFILEDMPGFYRDPHKDHWGRLAIDATKPWGRESEFERKRIPGADRLDLDQYLKGA